MSNQQFPNTRLRRTRSKLFSRELLQENTLLPKNLIQPFFIIGGENTKQEIPAMPGISRLTIDLLVIEAKKAMLLGIKAIALFPVIDESLKTPNGKYALDSNGLIPKAIIKLKKEIPNMGLIIDVALDPYTDHGHDGILDSNEYCDNDETIKVLVKQALLYAKSGADIIAPSDMMDGRVGEIRKALEENNFHQVQILSYAAKYASNFYGPFRQAVNVKQLKGIGNKSEYQMNPANTDEAMREIELDINEGADLVMVKPGLPYIDIIYRAKTEFNIPIFAYQVSGEYSMLKLSIENKLLDPIKGIIEPLMCIKRAGATAILTYFAMEIAPHLSSK